MTRLKMRPGDLWPLLIVLALIGCERAEEPTDSAPVAASDLDRVVDAMGGDALGAEIRRIKDLLADDRLADAERAASDLDRTRPSLPADRWIEIDRLEAVVSGVRR